MKILSIGNSYSEDAHRYFHALAKANGEDLFLVNLYIGGCSLQRHYLNMLDDVAAYDFQLNGQSTKLMVSIHTVLKIHDWDYITIQQASHYSFIPDTYTPYIEELYKYLKKYCPKTPVYLHQTWAYPFEAGRVTQKGFESTEEMFQAVRAGYAHAAELIPADGMILSGEAMLKAYQAKGMDAYRDPIHAGSAFGRYVLANVWFRKFFGEKEDFKHITEFDAPITEEDKQLAYEIAKSVVK